MSATLFPMHSGWKLRDLRAHLNHEALLIHKQRLVLRDTTDDTYALYEILASFALDADKIKIVAACELSDDDVNHVLDYDDLIESADETIDIPTYEIDKILANNYLNVYTFSSDTSAPISGEFVCVGVYHQIDHKIHAMRGDSPTKIISNLAMDYTAKVKASPKYAERTTT